MRRPQQRPAAIAGSGPECGTGTILADAKGDLDEKWCAPSWGARVGVKETQSNEERVLVLAASPADAELTVPVLTEVGIEPQLCATLGEIAREFREHGAAALVLVEDAIAGPDLNELTEALRYQPSWSDLPILLLTRSGAESPVAARWIALLGNVAVLERSVRPATLISTTRTAIRARQRQYALREQMEALRQSEERFELAAQVTQDVIWDLTCSMDAAGERHFQRAAYGSGSTARASGFEEWRERIHPEDRERVAQSLRSVCEGDQSLWSEEYRFRGSDGKYIHVVDRGQILRDATGQAARADGAMVDVTQR